MLKRIHRDQGGFTLVELLVTIAILAVLFGIVALGLAGVGSNAESEVESAEKGVVQSAVDIHMAVVATDAIPARDSTACAKIAEGEASFATYLRHLPTKCSYWWDATGVVTQATDCTDCP